jgi:hypothetical protein
VRYRTRFVDRVRTITNRQSLTRVVPTTRFETRTVVVTANHVQTVRLGPIVRVRTVTHVAKPVTVTHTSTVTLPPQTVTLPPQTVTTVVTVTVAVTVTVKHEH